jgi:AbiTii
MTTKSLSAHTLELSRELLDDIELDRLEPDKLLYKCSRLARLAGSEEVQAWLRFEMQGYVSSDPLAIKYMTVTGRWTDYEKRLGYWGPFAQQIEILKGANAKLGALRLPDISGDWAYASTTKVLEAINGTQSTITAMSQIRSRVIGRMHEFISTVYYEREFAALAESTFERYKKDVDALIATAAGDVLTKIPSVVDRLSEGSDEGISQALTTCRRILESFADAIYPPTDATRELGGNALKLDASKHQNRINAYIADRTESASRRQRLRQNLSNLFDRVSSGVHKDVTADEAFSLFLNTYLFLGEVLRLGDLDHRRGAGRVDARTVR